MTLLEKIEAVKNWIYEDLWEDGYHYVNLETEEKIVIGRELKTPEERLNRLMVIIKLREFLEE